MSSSSILSLVSVPASQAPILAGASAEQFEVYSIQGLLEQSKPSWLIDGLLPERGLVGVVGASGSGKSFFVLHALMSIANGSEFFGRKVEQGPVAYVAAEAHEGLAVRAAAWCQHAGLEPGAFENSVALLKIAVQLHEPYDVQRLIRSLESRKPKALAIDTLACCLGELDENSSSDMSRFLAGAKAVGEALGCAVVLVHHFGQSSDRPRGSTAFTAALDTEVHLKRREGWTDVTCYKQRDHGVFEPFKVRLVDVSLRGPASYAGKKSCVLEDAGDGKPFHPGFHTAHAKRVLQALEDAPNGSLNASELSSVLGLPSASIHRVLDELAKLRLIDSPRGRPRVAKLVNSDPAPETGDLHAANSGPSDRGALSSHSPAPLRGGGGVMRATDASADRTSGLPASEEGSDEG